MPSLQRRLILPFILLKPVVGNPLNIQDGGICLHMVATTLIPKCLCVGRLKEIAAECFPNVLTLRVSSQNATNADKSFEALLSHTIGELSKSDSIYRANPEETSMVSQSPEATPHLFSLALGESRVRAEKRRSGLPPRVVVEEERYITGIISELSCQLLIGRSCRFLRS